MAFFPLLSICLFCSENWYKETLLGSVESVLPEQIKAVLNRAKELNLLEETLKAEILSSKDGDEVRHISLIEYITGYNGNKLGLKNEKSMVTEESIQIDNTGDKEDLPETSSLASDESTINSESNSATDTVPQSDPIKPMYEATLDMGNESESSKTISSTSKAIVVGSTIAALAVGGGITYAVLKPSNKLDEPDSNEAASAAHSRY